MYPKTNNACAPQVSIRHWLIAVAGLSVVFACFGVTEFVTAAIAVLAISAVITKPISRKEWLVLLAGAVAAIPWFLLAWLYAFALRVAFFVGHWPFYNHPDPKDLPDRFHPHSELLEFAIPVLISSAATSFLLIVMRSAQSARRPPGISFALAMAFAVASCAIIVLVLDPAGVLKWLVD